jgi:hypothetical protein
MSIRDLETQDFADLFPANPANAQRPTNFTGTEPQEGNIFDNPQAGSVGETTTVAPSVGETTTLAPDSESTTTTTTVEGNEPGDILSDTKPKAGRKPKYNFEDISGYFEDRIKSGKFVAVEQDGEDGPTQFIPKTPEEFDEVIDIQVNYQLEQKKKELEQSWYATKSPAWKAVAKYAEMTDNPADILPFLQGVRTIDSVAEIDETQPEGAEAIVRARLEQRGEPKDVIDDQIEVLKNSDKLLTTAQKYKPLILQQEKAQLTQMVQQQEAQEAEYRQLVENIRDGAIKAIEAPLFGKSKLSREEKAAVYELIAVPNEESQGYQIYQEIDSLFEKGDFETLTMLSLLLKKKDAFIGHISTSAANSTAAELQKKIRIADTNRSSGGSGDVEVPEKRPVVQRNSYTGAVRFGRG